MMKSRLLTWIIGAVALVLVIGLVARSFYFAPVAKLRDKLDSWNAGKAQMEASLADADTVRDRLRAFAETGLGKSTEVAEHRLRTLLGQLCDQSGLAEYVIATREPVAVADPAAKARPVEFNKAMRQEADFVEIEASISGVGPYASAVQALALLERQPWLHRVKDFSIQASSADRKQYEFRASVSTILLPDLATVDTGEQATVEPVPGETLDRLIAWNPFVVVREPTPEVKPQVASLPPEPPSPPYGDWHISGVMHSSQGDVEVIVNNTRTGQSRTLSRGATLLGLTLTGVKGDRVSFTEGESGYEVALGESLADRVRLIE
ncbi:MAG TPA: hypothetical protein ENJ00_00295 [Phycisphaerales bacterium]|nr:hypothetical protein [Phycisphaerales bacterium]